MINVPENENIQQQLFFYEGSIYFFHHLAVCDSWVEQYQGKSNTLSLQVQLLQNPRVSKASWDK